MDCNSEAKEKPTSYEKALEGLLGVGAFLQFLLKEMRNSCFKKWGWHDDSSEGVIHVDHVRMSTRYFGARKNNRL